MKILITALILTTMSVSAKEIRVYFGTYTKKDSKGIYYATLDLKTGVLKSKGLAAETANPSFLAIHPSQQYLYAVNETDPGRITAFAFNPDGTLKFLNDRPAHGGAPCHLSIDKTGKTVLIANYTTGNIVGYRIMSDGKLSKSTVNIQHEGSSVDPKRQKGPHAHSIDISPDNRFAVSADLGTDEIRVYKLKPVFGKITPHDTVKIEPGSGPRHFAFHPSNKFAYLLNEMNSTITTLSYGAAAGKLKVLDTQSTLPPDFDKPNSTAEIIAHPFGDWVYASNRGHDSIAVFAVDKSSGKLKLIEHQSTRGKTPRSFGIDPTGTFLLAANQNSDYIALFTINPLTGKLEHVEEANVPVPVCVVFKQP